MQRSLCLSYGCVDLLFNLRLWVSLFRSRVQTASDSLYAGAPNHLSSVHTFVVICVERKVGRVAIIFTGGWIIAGFCSWRVVRIVLHLSMVRRPWDTVVRSLALILSSRLVAGNPTVSLLFFGISLVSLALILRVVTSRNTAFDDCFLNFCLIFLFLLLIFEQCSKV